METIERQVCASPVNIEVRLQVSSKAVVSFHLASGIEDPLTSTLS